MGKAKTFLTEYQVINGEGKMELEKLFGNYHGSNWVNKQGSSMNAN